MLGLIVSLALGTHGQAGIVRTYTLHKFMQPIGEEKDFITTSNNHREVQAHFKFIDRGSSVEHQATLTTSMNYEPKTLSLKGLIARGSEGDIDIVVDQNGTAATVTRLNKTFKVAVPKGSCAISGYAPIAFQENMMETWIARGKPANMPILPNGSVKIRLTSQDRFGSTTLDRYSIKGLVWGLQSIWLNANNQIVAVVTRDAEFDHFEAVTPEFEKYLPDFARLSGEDSTKELARGISNLNSKAAAPTAIIDGRLFDGEHVTDHSYVLLKGGKIAACGPWSKNQSFPKGTKIINANGMTIMPGLWDMHAHFEQAEWGPCYLAAGVTTARDCGNVFEFITGVRDSLEKEVGVGPRLILAGLVDGDGPISLGINRVNSTADANQMVAKYRKKNFQQIKIYSSVKLDNLRAICDATHAAGMSVTGHVPQGITTRQGIEAGMDQINHIQYLMSFMLEKDGREPSGTKEAMAAMSQFDPDSASAREKIDFLLKHKTVVDPTIALMELFMHDASISASSFEPGILKVPVELSGPMNAMAAGGSSNSSKLFQFLIQIVGLLHKNGIPIMAGTDQAVPGHSLHRELELYVKSGMSPIEALQTATTVPAKAMKLDGKRGWIKPGYDADVIVVQGDPTKHIEDSRAVRYVFARGKQYDPPSLWRAIGFKP
ncbi:MAG: amidohydrolase family protein [Armatimonadota bacterium]